MTAASDHSKARRAPGGFGLAQLPDKAAIDLHQLLNLAASHLADANLALVLFDEAWEAVGSESRDEALERWQRDRDEVRAAEARLEAEQTPPVTIEESLAARHKIRVVAERAVQQARSARGELPGELGRLLPFMYARTFVYGLDGVASALVAITRLTIPTDAGEALDQLNNRLPDLRYVRNTAHHPEDRIRRVDKYGKPLEPQPPVVILDNLADKRYWCTLPDGQGTAQVEVSAQSLLAAQDAIQSVIDSVKWKGLPRVTPHF